MITSRGLAFSALLVAVALVGGLWVHGAYMATGRNTNLITVTGSVKQKVTSDLAKWHGSFSLRSNLTNIKDTIARSGDLAKKIQEFARSEGFADADMAFAPVQTNSIYENAKGGYYGPAQDLIGYNVMQDVRIQNSDIAKVEKFANDIKSLAGQGIVFDFQQTEFYYTKLPELRPKLFADATKDALERAQAIASGTGVKVGPLRTARTGVVQVLAPDSIDVADYGAYDLSTKEKEISATVNVSFELR